MTPETETAPPAAVSDVGDGSGEIITRAYDTTSKSSASKRGKERGQGCCTGRGSHQGRGRRGGRFNRPA